MRVWALTHLTPALAARGWWWGSRNSVDLSECKKPDNKEDHKGVCDWLSCEYTRSKGILEMLKAEVVRSPLYAEKDFLGLSGVTDGWYTMYNAAVRGANMECKPWGETIVEEFKAWTKNFLPEMYSCVKSAGGGSITSPDWLDDLQTTCPEMLVDTVDIEPSEAAVAQEGRFSRFWSEHGEDIKWAAKATVVTHALWITAVSLPVSVLGAVMCAAGGAGMLAAGMMALDSLTASIGHRLAQRRLAQRNREGGVSDEEEEEEARWERWNEGIPPQGACQLRNRKIVTVPRKAAILLGRDEFELETRNARSDPTSFDHADLLDYMDFD